MKPLTGSWPIFTIWPRALITVVFSSKGKGAPFTIGPNPVIFPSSIQRYPFSHILKAGITSAMIGPGSANVVGGTFCFVKTHGRCIDDMLALSPAAMKIAFGDLQYKDTPFPIFRRPL